MARLTVEVITAERSVVTDEADMVIAPTVEGSIGILPWHVALLTALAPGVMVLKNNDGSERDLVLSGGFLEVLHNHVLVLADTAERAEDIDEQQAAEAKARADDALKEAALHPTAIQSEAAHAALRLSLARLSVAQHGRRRRTP